MASKPISVYLKELHDSPQSWDPETIVLGSNGDNMPTAFTMYDGRKIPHYSVTGTTLQMVLNTSYCTYNASLTTLTLPTPAETGDIIEVQGLGAGGWRIAQNANQSIHVGNQVTTVGTGGRLDSTNQYDVVILKCIKNELLDTIWTAYGIQGNLNLT